jgi:hypothetical protein
MSVSLVQGAIDFIGRFGNPRIQCFKVNERLRLSVEYRIAGGISAIEIAPVGYRGFDPSQPPEVLSEVANSILEKILPGITASGLTSETTIQSKYPGFSREVRSVPGASLIRDYPLGDDRSKMIAASLEVNCIDLTGVVNEVTYSMGAPEYLQFAGDSGLAVGVSPDSQGSVRHIAISAQENLLAHPDSVSPIGREAAEKLLSELLPSSAEQDQPGRSCFRAGAYRVERLHFANFLLCRYYVSDQMTGISIDWPKV